MLDYLNGRWLKENAGCEDEKPHHARKIDRPNKNVTKPDPLFVRAGRGKCGACLTFFYFSIFFLTGIWRAGKFMPNG